MNHLSSATQQTASASEELSATAEELSAQAAALRDLMAFFTLVEAVPVSGRPRAAGGGGRPAPTGRTTASRADADEAAFTSF